MEALPPGTPPAGVFLSLLTESFAVRALLGSLVAGGMAAAALRCGWVRAPRTRRVVLLAPILAAVAAAAVASVRETETYLPQLWIASSPNRSGQVLELLGELRVISDTRGVDVLFLAWAAVVTVLLSRRVWGALATHRLLRRAEPVAQRHELQRLADRLVVSMGARAVRVRLLAGCPGGALACGLRRSVIVVDPVLLRGLDPQEAEGLLAHEVAHVARRDTLVGLAVGVVCDMTFFLPAAHLVPRWLHREREESADEWASAHTRRPAALASGILKVWETSAPRPSSLQACSAGVSSAASPWRRRASAPQMSEGARTVAARVERLVAPPRRNSVLRQVAEVSIAAAVIVAASAATLVVPHWIADDLDASALAIGYVPPAAQPVESAAFATFRALAPVSGNPEALQGWERAAHLRQALPPERLSACPCVETQAQWLAGQAAATPGADAVMAWRRTASPSWAVTPAPGAVRARPLLTLRDSGPQVGFFVVAKSRP